MMWADLLPLANDAPADLLLLDASVVAVGATRDMAPHAPLTAEVPSPLAMCTELDVHGIPVPYDREAQIAMRQRLGSSRAQALRQPGKSRLRLRRRRFHLACSMGYQRGSRRWYRQAFAPSDAPRVAGRSSPTGRRDRLAPDNHSPS